MEVQEHDRRRNARFNAPKKIFVAWQGGGKKDVSTLETVGLGGLSVRVKEPPPRGTFLQVLLDGPRGQVRARAKVVHSKLGRNMGLQFLQMETEDRARLFRFVKDLEAGQRRQVFGPPASWFALNQHPPDSGDINSRHALFVLLHWIYASRLTGKLQLVFGPVEKQLFFDCGQLVFATSSNRQDSLGEMMLGAGALTQSEFDQAAELVKTGQRFGSAVAELGICTIEEVVSWIERQLRQIAASVLEYSACRYYFFQSIEKNVVPEVGIRVSPGNLLLEAVRKANDLPLEQLAAEGDFTVEVSSDPVLRFRAVELNADEQSVLSAVSQPVPAKKILCRSEMPVPRAARAFYALMALGIVCEVVECAQPEPKQAAQAPAPEPERQAVKETEEAASMGGAKEFEEEIKKVLQIAAKGTHYDVLGVTAASTAAQVKQSFHILARKFHPDHHMGRSEWVGLLQALMSRLSEAYKTLTDPKKRASYDKQLETGGAFQLGQGKTESQETVEECLSRAKDCLRCNNYAGSILWLQKCVELAPEVAQYHAVLARSLAALPEYRREAVAQFERALEIDPWNTSVYLQFGELYELMQLPWRAVPLYRKILEIDPDHSKARERLHRLEPEPEDQGESRFAFLSSMLPHKNK